jgi:surface protein
MTNTLQKKLNEILTDKNTNLLPENLKKGIRCLGVDGTLEASTSSGGVKQFNTVEEMNASTGNKDGDLAVVYRNEMKPVSNGDTITSMTFPKTVVFTEAITSNYNGRLRNSSEPIIYLDIQLNASNFTIMDMYGTIPGIEYSSTDGITYTRTDSNEDTYEIGETTVRGLDEHICKFIQIGGNVFEGLYEYDIKTSKYAFTIDGNTFFLPEDFVSKYSDSSYDDGLGARPFYDYGGAVIEILEYDEHNIITNFNWYQSGGGDQLRQLQKDGKMYFAADTYGDLSIRHYNNGTMTGNNYGSNPSDNYLDWNPSPGYELLCNSGSGKFRAIKEITSNTKLGLFETHANSYWNDIKYVYSVDNNVASITTTPSYISNTHDIAAYNIAKTQLTTLADDVYLTDFYGKNGIETGTLTKNISYSFADINAEVYDKIQKAYAAMEPKILTDTDKTVDNNIYFIPVNAQGEPLWDTSAVTNMNGMFSSCTNLKEIPLLNTSNVTSMYDTFSDCTNLTTIPLLDTSKVTNMDSMFSMCQSLVTIPLLDTSNVTHFERHISRMQ